MQDPEELALILKAITSGLSNCLFWKNDATENRIRKDRELQGMTPHGIKRELIQFVKAGGLVEQVAETRESYRGEYVFYYKAIIDITDLPSPFRRDGPARSGPGCSDGLHRQCSSPEELSVKPYPWKCATCRI